MNASRADRGVVAVVAVVVVAVAVAAVVGPLAARNRPEGTWDVRAVEVIAAAAAGAPVTAFVDASCAACRDPLLQLRVCPAASGTGAIDAATCDVAARRAPGDGVTVVRYARPLAPGTHRVEVLFLARDGLGAARSVARVEAWVDVR